MIELPQDVLTIMDIIKEYGAESYVVGGCVRDSLLGRNPQDWDICSPVLPSELMPLFHEKGYRTIETGIQHGTFTVIINNECYEITTYRRDGKYTDNRHPDNIEFISDLEEDLARRDFTINAIAYNPNRGIIDPFCGEEDLQDGTLRCVGNAKERFQEDALRIMRALRFSATLNFSIEEQTSKAMLETAPLLQNIAVERINKEFTSILLSNNPREILMRYEYVIKQFIPAISVYVYPLYDNICKWVERAPKDITVRLAIFLSGIYDYQPILSHLRYDNITTNDVCTLIDHINDVYCLPTPVTMKKYLRDYGSQNLYRFIDIKLSCPYIMQIQHIRYSKCRQLLDEIIRKDECYSLRQLQVNGRDLIKLGMKPGQSIGKLLNMLLNEVIDGYIENDPIMLIARAGVLIKEGDFE